LVAIPLPAWAGRGPSARSGRLDRVVSGSKTRRNTLKS
jgi:hypothetical protein